MSRHSPAGAERRRVRQPVAVVVGLAWAVLVAASLTSAGGAAHRHGGHGSGGGATGIPVDLRLLAVMVVAMTGPLLVAPLRHVTQRTLPRQRRARAVALVAGLLAPWLLVSVVLAVVAALVGRSPVGRTGGLVLAGAVALAWQCAPAKQHCLNRTHRHAVLVAHAHRGNVRTAVGGAAHAGWCIGSCGPIMLVAGAAGHGVVAMALAALWMGAEHVEPARRPTWRPVVPTRLLRAATVRSGAWVAPA